ncbi:MAG: hypothetical protein BKP49_07155 [Treponema sp. CETP13]|nr:MAG: hypothetical protein BKP49_07155 [Treponema sp. CETP13]
MQIQQLVSEIINNFLKDDTSCVLNLVLDISQFSFIKENCPKTSVSFDLNDPEVFFSPLAPFFSCLDFIHPSQNVLKAVTYSLQYESFRSWFDNKICQERKDMVLETEFFYEKQRCYNTVATLLSESVDTVYIIENAQKMGQESFELLSIIEKKHQSNKFIFCFDTNEFSEVAVNNTFFNEITLKPNYYEIPIHLEKNYIHSFGNASVYQNYLEKGSAKDIFTILRNNRTFFSYKPGKEIEKYLKSELYLINFTQEEWAKLFLECAKIEIYAKNFDDGIFYLSSCLEQKCSCEVEAEVNLWFAFVYEAKSLFETEKMYARIARSKAKKDSYLYALGLQYEHSGEDQLEKSTSIEGFKFLLAELQRQGLKNNYINASLHIPKQMFQDVSKLPELISHIDIIIEEAKKLDNKCALSTGYHWKGILISMQGDSENALLWNKKCHALRVAFGDMLSRIKSGNGLAYDYLLRAEYVRSFEIENQFLVNVFKNADKNEMVMTFYNAAKTLFFGRDFSRSFLLLQKTQHLMQMFHIPDSFFCNSDDFVILKAVIDFLFGRYVQASTGLYNVKINNKEVSLYVQVLQGFLESLFLLKDGKVDVSEKTLNEALKKGIHIEHEKAFICFEYAEQLYKFEEFQLAKTYHELGLSIAKKNNFIYYLQNFSEKTPGIYQGLKAPFPNLLVNLDLVEEMISKELLVNRVQKKMQEGRFLNQIAALAMRCDSAEKYVASFCQHFFDYLVVKGIYVAQKTNNNKWEIIGKCVFAGMVDPPEEKWEKLYALKKNSVVFQVNRISESMYYVNLSQYTFNACVLFVTSKSSPLTSDDKSIIQVAFSHLQSSLIIFEQNKELYKMSTTDDLTGLYNRRALTEKIKQTEVSVKLTKDQGIINVSFIFIDLDNFKYYNDKFGHTIGDFLLQKFAGVLKRVFRSSDSIYRYGGDEFIIFTLDVRKPNSERAIARIREALKDENYFIPAIEKEIGKTIEIPADMKLGFSAGICTNTESLFNWDLDTMLQYSDSAMYKAKNKGKNCTIIYEE